MNDIMPEKAFDTGSDDTLLSEIGQVVWDLFQKNTYFGYEKHLPMGNHVGKKLL